MEGIDEYKLIQADSRTYRLHIVSGRTDRNRMREEATEILKQPYGRESAVSIIFEKDIAPEASGKYLKSKSLFSIKLDKYLDERYTPRV